MKEPTIVIYQRKDVDKRLYKILENFETPEIKLWLCPDETALEFSSMLTVAKKHSKTIVLEEFVPPIHYNCVLTSLLLSGLKNVKSLSKVFEAVCDTILLSKDYQSYMYINRPFWEAIFRKLFTLPDVQFFEAMMMYAAVIAQVSSQSEISDRAREERENLVIVSSSDFNMILRYVEAEKYADVFRRLLQLQEKNISSQNGATFGLDYNRVMERFFATDLHRSYWQRDSSHPVDVIAILMFTFIAHPDILDALVNKSDGVKVLMDVLRSKACKRMHVLIMFSFDNLIVNTHIMIPQIFRGLMRTIDYSLMLIYATSDSEPYAPKDSSLRKMSQKIVIDTLRHRENDSVGTNQSYFQKIEVLTAVDLITLERLLCKDDAHTSKFCVVLTSEIVVNGSKRDIVVDSEIPRCAAKFLSSLVDADTNSSDNVFVILKGLSLFSRLGLEDKKRQEKLSKINVVGVVAKFLTNNNELIRIACREAVSNLTEFSHDARVEVFKVIKFKNVVTEAHQYYVKRLEKKLTMPQDGSDNSYLNIDNETANKIMRISSYFINMHDLRTLDFTSLSVLITSRLLELDMINIEKFITDDFLSKVLNHFADMKEDEKRSYSFAQVYVQRCPQPEKELKYNEIVSSKEEEESKETEAGRENKQLGVKCAWPPCLNYGRNKETKECGIVLKPLKKCGNCLMIAYCGRTCQKLHWKEHKRTCQKED
ncbi:uncharacterized protein LOC130656543 isoform X2 [Hydractinia symbiolongicarpus]|uniref:uncharacterized protein LOC130656543 isoform X2 n=1 Tax=Hydractinia symbiolongicarpus TaxID=13093 RepID=UPI00254A2F3E|nr:uncharacterized protein LOC130656543 isoform X2 [Hydractinia symbiolongicarpus]